MNRTLSFVGFCVAIVAVCAAGCGQAKKDMKAADDPHAATSSPSEVDVADDHPQADESEVSSDASWSGDAEPAGAEPAFGDSWPASAAPDTFSNSPPSFAAEPPTGTARRPFPTEPSFAPADSPPPNAYVPRMAARARAEVSPEASMAPDAIIAGDAAERPSAAPSAPISTALPAAATPGVSVVRVFYGTDRRRDTAAAKIAEGWFAWEPAAIAGAVAVLLIGAAVWTGWRKRLGAVAALALVAMCVLAYNPVKQLLTEVHKPSGLESYGNARGEMETGVCEVTIPPRHRVGEVESPTILRFEVRPDAARHVVLSSLEPMESDAFYAELQRAVQESQRRELMVFIHGFNVTFDDAVKRTAQIAFDLKFSGAPVCYSWPSQGGILKYTVDETNVAWTVPHLKQFLLSIVGRTGAESINVIAHSMGNRALTAALRDVAFEMREQKTLFNQVVLAAPDIDADVFKTDIAPAILPTARQFTLYASSDDQALRASRRVHGYARAGDSGDDLVVVPGIETIDVSGIDTSFLGHSYYASNDAILADLHEVVHGAMPAGRRRLLSPAMRDGLPYWVLKGAAVTALRAVESQR